MDNKIINKILKQDHQHIWHPAAQMKDYETFPPILVQRAKGPFLYDAKGKPVIDAISSWWCKSLGHSHPRLKEAAIKQINSFEHIITANVTHLPLIELSNRLSSIVPGLDKVFYCDNGSTAVEVAMKMSLQCHAQTGNPGKNQFMALKNGYHGETIMTLAAGDLGLYNSPFVSILPAIDHLGPVPYVRGQDDPLFMDAGSVWPKIKDSLDKKVESLAAVLFEPIVQGAGGMLIYSPDLLKRLRKWANENNVHLIADEIMTGMGRTGYSLASEYADIIPDFVLLSKGLTGGWIPMAVTLTSTAVYDVFYDDYNSKKGFMHSNTYCGNALACAVAVEALDIYEEEKIFERVQKHGPGLKERMSRIAKKTGLLTNIRGIGFMAAADLCDENNRPFEKGLRMGYQVYQEAVKIGALLRPLGDTIYFLPPLNTPLHVLDELEEITLKAIKKVINKRIL